MGLSRTVLRNGDAPSASKQLGLTEPENTYCTDTLRQDITTLTKQITSQEVQQNQTKEAASGAYSIQRNQFNRLSLKCITRLIAQQLNIPNPCAPFYAVN